MFDLSGNYDMQYAASNWQYVLTIEIGAPILKMTPILASDRLSTNNKYNRLTKHT